MKTQVVIKKKNGLAYLVVYAVSDGDLQEIGKVFAGTEKALPQGTGKQLLKKISAHGPFIHSPKDQNKTVTIPAKLAEVIAAAKSMDNS